MDTRLGAIIATSEHSFDNGRVFDAARLTMVDTEIQALRGFNGAARAQYEPYRRSHLASKDARRWGEIADVAGLAAAYDAYRVLAGTAPPVQGFKGDQQFFISFAQSWRGKIRTASEPIYGRTPPRTEPHRRHSSCTGLDVTDNLTGAGDRCGL